MDPLKVARSSRVGGAGSRSAPRIRRASLDDLSLLADLARRTFLAAFGPDNDADDVGRYVEEAFSEARVGDQLADARSTFLLVEEAAARGSPDPVSGAGPVAYAHLRSGTTPSIRGDRPVELVRIYVEHHLTGSGYGGVLLRAVIDEARSRGHDTLWLGVWEHNLAAQRFYARRGFTQVGEVSFVLGDDLQTDRIMSLPLTLPAASSLR